ncbi:ComF family protein [Fructilactobacillus fructivorans]|uniref:ComF family protein n=2 Tax=Fructilactobacillus fructivorans TaxID=1614 RepID=A0AAE6TWJ9_9LACO|nr:phosphoribosyltransferase family protein [Fructilactobacillus fructivorans]QFX92986.1 ComF family protein [Fructilactobacillus fructivorans]RDV65411.1 ComF family protein [Fructilactobacillus fructivorans]
MGRYKFQGDYELRKLFQKQFQSFILAHATGVLIVPIPISEKTLAVRKFNQVEGWLEGLSYQKVLEAESRDGLPQSRKNKRERMQLKQPFSVRNDWKQRLKNRSICLIDDVYTTGTTLHLASDLLYSFGAKNVSSITFAR